MNFYPLLVVKWFQMNHPNNNLLMFPDKIMHNNLVLKLWHLLAKWTLLSFKNNNKNNLNNNKDYPLLNKHYLDLQFLKDLWLLFKDLNLKHSIILKAKELNKIVFKVLLLMSFKNQIKNIKNKSLTWLINKYKDPKVIGVIKDPYLLKLLLHNPFSKSILNLQMLVLLIYHMKNFLIEMKEQ